MSHTAVSLDARHAHVAAVALIDRALELAQDFAELAESIDDGADVGACQDACDAGSQLRAALEAIDAIGWPHAAVALRAVGGTR